MENTVQDNVYYNNYGEPIPFGSKIKMSFAGNPIDMTQPYTLVEAVVFFSTVSHKEEVRLYVQGTNKVSRWFKFARYYNPRLIEEPEDQKMALFECPNCKRSISTIEDDVLYIDARCPECDELFQIPQRETNAISALLETVIREGIEKRKQQREDLLQERVIWSTQDFDRIDAEIGELEKLYLTGRTEHEQTTSES
jgi:DNA-directed RNA polymerase subunit RPC12/RpoP